MPGDAALAWCNRDDYGWCGMHNRPFGHCRAEALDTIAAERARIRAAVEAMPTARVISQWDLISRRAVLAIIYAEDTDAHD